MSLYNIRLSCQKNEIECTNAKLYKKIIKLIKVWFDLDIFYFQSKLPMNLMFGSDAFITKIWTKLCHKHPPNMLRFNKEKYQNFKGCLSFFFLYCKFLVIGGMWIGFWMLVLPMIAWTSYTFFFSFSFWFILFFYRKPVKN